jgi:hypothetical protein
MALMVADTNPRSMVLSAFIRAIRGKAFSVPSAASCKIQFRFGCGSAAPGHPWSIESVVPGFEFRVPGEPRAEAPINPPRRNRRGSTSGLAPISVH